MRSEHASMQIGDIACLKSGGPLITVESTEGDKAVCLWFQGDRLRRETFALALIEKRKSKSESLAETLERARKRAALHRQSAE